jgi:ABC-type sulfate transport system substrate-binding protein
MDVRQCLIYDSAAKNARLIGVEYMITRELYEGLEPEEQKMWHSHEVRNSPVLPPIRTNHSNDHPLL